MYKPQKTVISADSKTILNTIRDEIGGAFRDATPLVSTLDDVKAYGDVVMGGGEFRNQFVGMLNKIAQTIVWARSYENQLKLFKRGLLEAGETVEQLYVNLVMPEGYTQSVENPGDVFQTNNPDVRVAYSPVNYFMVYETTVNDNELSLAFQSMGGVANLRDVIVRRLEDSAEVDDFIMTKVAIAKAFLANEDSAVVVDDLEAATSDDFITKLKNVSNDMRFMNDEHTPAGVPAHTPVDSQVFIETSKVSAVTDVATLAKSFHLSEVEFLGRQIMVNKFGFSDFEKVRLAQIVTETKKQGILAVGEFTNEEYAKLDKIVGVVCDETAFPIWDRLDIVRSIYDARHLNENMFRHAWRVITFNPFAQATFFVTE